MIKDWLEQTIRRYEHRRWSTDSNRRVLPFQWGLEHIGGRADEPDPRGFLRAWVGRTLATSDEWFAACPAEDYRLSPPGSNERDGRVLTFTSAVRSPWEENNRVHARLFAVSRSGPAVVVLPQWNAKWDVQVNICRWLNTMGITALRLSLPYHDRRMVPGSERADSLVGPNIGLTLQANRQAVLDARQCLLWLREQGYGKLGLVYHDGARPSGASRGVPARFDLFCGCGAHGHEHESRVGSLARARRRGGVAAVLVADQPVSVCAEDARRRAENADGVGRV
jgi:hypothetical protein